MFLRGVNTTGLGKRLLIFMLSLDVELVLTKMKTGVKERVLLASAFLQQTRAAVAALGGSEAS